MLGTTVRAPCLICPARPLRPPPLTAHAVAERVADHLLACRLELDHRPRIEPPIAAALLQQTLQAGVCGGRVGGGGGRGQRRADSEVLHAR